MFEEITREEFIDFLEKVISVSELKLSSVLNKIISDCDGDIQNYGSLSAMFSEDSVLYTLMSALKYNCDIHLKNRYIDDEKMIYFMNEYNVAEMLPKTEYDMRVQAHMVNLNAMLDEIDVVVDGMGKDYNPDSVKTLDNQGINSYM